MPYRAFILKILSDLRASYWFIPTCLVFASWILAELLLYVDRGNVSWIDPLLAEIENTQIDGARTILSVIAQSVIGVTGVMFSVTMVAVSFASGNFGPRLIGNFMRDRGNQWSLGILISTFVYALIILRSVQSPAEGGPEVFVPQASIIVAMGLALVSVFVMIFFVHHVPETINVSNIVAGLGERLCAALTSTAHDCAPHDPLPVKETHAVTLSSPGYVQRVDTEQMQEIAEENDLRIDLLIRPGMFVNAAFHVARVAGDLSDDAETALKSAIALGKAKTEDQNLLFIAEQQVEMLARALSPGVNDPHTAIDCLNWLAAGIVAGAREGACFGIRPTERVSVPPIDLAVLLDQTFGAARPYVDRDEMTLSHWQKLLDEMAASGGDTLRSAIRPLRKG
ncbi:DUF2254 domain-containing protein [Ovoidimarina sediminis]|uniref:DUF2254 domain-containing protein n=1 Tax=Ovoidimarina sediminis TaxID=3079856 RepID=UPI00290767B5|nr:DUF2254 domain-containing protein [Rhodophyticola sp. MJ-SS7]MDU8944630.1 DUF2254 domain-containing protein [Rhodophyticola sp. MJ-SS7]